MKTVIGLLTTFLVFIAITLGLLVGRATPRPQAPTKVKFATKMTIRDTLLQEEAFRAAARDAMRYRGTHVHAHPQAPKDQAAIQNRVADLLNRLDFVPTLRLEHFNRTWRGLDDIRGWTGEVKEIMSVEGGLVVKVDIFPIPGGGKAVVNDFIEEHYFFDGDQIRFLEAFDNDIPRITTFN